MDEHPNDGLDGAQTRERLMVAAERLFSERGFGGTSVRDITAAAGANLAAVSYHFGGKERLYGDVLTRRLRALREQRIDAIRSAGRGGASATLEQVLDAYAGAVLSPIADPDLGRPLVRLMTREFVERRLPEAICAELMEPVDAALAGALRRALPGLGEDDAAFTASSINAQLFHVIHMAHLQGTIERPESLGRSLEDARRHIVRFSAAGARACAGDLPR